jgi:NAD(P)H-flavin reductase/ferredoxin
VPNLRIGDREIRCDEGETVLDALLRSGIAHPYSCRSGACHSCLVRAKSGTAPEAAQGGLSAPMRARGFFLACVAPCASDLVIESASDTDLQVTARVDVLERLAGDVLRLRLVPQGEFECRAGQFVGLVRADGLTRSYSVASLPDVDGYLELHVKILPGGQMSRHLASEVSPGDSMRIRASGGECFYVAGKPDQPLVLAGTGTGLAPLLGVLRDALRCGHRGEILLLHGALDQAGLYARAELDAIARATGNVSVLYSALRPGVEAIDSTPLDRMLFERKPDLSGHRVFICGAPEFVQSVRRQAFLKGASLREIHADAFVTRAHVPSPS